MSFFVKEVIKETEDIINKLNEQDITIANLKKELEEEKNSTRLIDEIISIAEKNRDDIMPSLPYLYRIRQILIDDNLLCFHCVA